LEIPVVLNLIVLCPYAALSEPAYWFMIQINVVFGITKQYSLG